MTQKCETNNNGNVCQIDIDINNRDTRKENWALLVKPTHGCNLDCQYCYDKPFRTKFGNKVMSFEIVRHILDLATKHAKNISWIWHGGEPTIVGIE